MAKSFVPHRQPTPAESAAASEAVFGPPKQRARRDPDAKQDARERATARGKARASTPMVQKVQKMESSTAMY